MRHDVCILRDFCPLCFRGGACGERVPKDSPRIDEEQRECSRVFGGLPLLDLQRPGGKCHRACRLICLACGNPMAFPCEPEFESALDLTERYEEDMQETRAEVLEGMHDLGRSLGEMMLEDLERRFTRKLRRMGMAWHPRWERLVHSRCLQKAPCGCLVATGVQSCLKHKKPVIKPPRIRKQQAVVTPEIKRAPSPMKKLTVMVLASAKPVTMIKATWLKPSESKVTVHHAASQAEKKSVILSKPPTPKPNPKLEAAAKGSSKLDAWTGKAQENTVSAAPKSKKFCLARHERDFDQFQHGYLRKNGIDMYRFPDGTEVKVFSNVNEMTEDGLLRCADTTKEEEVAPPAANEPMQATKESQLKKPPPKKSNPKLETAAKGSSRLDAWLGARK